MRQNFNDGQEILYTDLNSITKNVEQTFLDFVLKKAWKDQTDKVWGQSFKVSRVNATTLQVGVGVGIQQDLTQVAPETTQRILCLQTAVNKTITAAHATLNRIDIVSIKATLVDDTSVSRRFKDAGTDAISTTSQVINKKWELDIVVTAGTPNASPAVPSTPSGYMKIAEVLVTAVTGIAASGAITDRRAFFTVDGYSKVVGASFHCSHATLAEAVAAAVTGDNILVEDDETVNTAITVSVGVISIEFKKGVAFTKGSATKGLIISATAVEVIRGRFLQFSTAGDKAIEVSVGANRCLLYGQRFLNCDTEINDLSNNASILGNFSE